MAVSEAAMRRARAMLGEPNEVAATATTPGTGTAAKAPTGTPGSSAFAFVTGNGATVGVSAAALARARGLFDDAPPPAAGAVSHPSTVPASTPNAGGFRSPFAADARAAAGVVSGATASATRSFNSPMLPGAARRAGTARPAAASILGKRERATGTRADGPRGAGAGLASASAPAAAPSSSAPSVHDLFASRGASREPLSAFFRGLRPHERPASSRGVDAVVRAMTADTAIGYRVPSGDGAGASLSAESFRQRMLAAGAVDRLLHPDWVRNAHRWVVWQQACVARAFPETLAAGALAAPAVLQRLLYRYERETLRASRPHLRRVLERDSPAGAPAVLVVSAIRRAGAGADDAAEIEVSDGWYGVAARLDRALSDQLRRGRLFVGQKILVQGAELRGVAEPTPPLSAAAEDAFLALRANGVRPARWDAKLGARRRAEAFPLRTLRPDGGPVSRVLVHVERVYPTCWQETGRADGRVVTRGDAAEARAAREWEANRGALLERVAHDLRAETEAARAAAGPGSGSAFDGFDGFDDAAERRARDALDAAGLLERRVRRAMKLRVSGLRRVGPDGRVDGPTGAALLTVFDADEDLARILVEGSRHELVDATCGGRGGCLELTAGRKTRWRPVAPAACARAGLEAAPTPRRLAGARDLGVGGGVAPGEEFDAVAVLLHASAPAPADAPRRQWAFLVDASAAAAANSGFGGDVGGVTADLLAVEIDARSAEAFASTREWGGGEGLGAGAPRVAPGPGAGMGRAEPPRVVALALENLEYARRDAANGLQVARFTEFSRAAPLPATGARRGGGGGGIGGGDAAWSKAAARAAAELRSWLAPGGGADVPAIVARVRALTENQTPAGAAGGGGVAGTAETTGTGTNGAGVRAIDATTGAGAGTGGASSGAHRSPPPRRKRSLSIGSEVDWGASQLERIDEAEALALEARRRREDAETRPTEATETETETEAREDSEAMFAAAAGDTEPQERA